MGYALVGLSLVFLITVVLLVHEAGHYAVAKLVGAPLVSVRIGVGPQLWRWSDADGVEWRVGALPVIAWVRLCASARDTLAPTRRLAIVLGGPVASVVFGVFLLAVHGGALSVLAGDTAGAGVGDGLRMSFAVLAGMVLDFLDLLARVLTGSGLDVVRPVVAPVAGGSGALLLVLMAGVMSLGVGAFNLLPLPWFDGGQALATTVELVAGRRVAAVVEEVMLWIALVGLFVVFVLWPASP